MVNEAIYELGTQMIKVYTLHLSVYMPTSLHSETLKDLGTGQFNRANQLRKSYPSVVMGPNVPLPVLPVCNGSFQ